MAILSKRLKAVADMVTPNQVVADIGCDHAYLPIYLVKNKIAPFVFACDVNDGPVRIAKDNVAQVELNDYIKCLKGDGLAPVIDKDIQTVIIAGMGGRLMMRILSEGKELLKRVKEIVLEPQSEVSQLRFFLEKNGYCIVSEDMVCEDGKFYPIMKAIHGNMNLKEEIYYRYGKIPIRERHPVLHEFLIREKQYFGKLLENMSEHVDSDIAKKRIEEINIDLKICERALLEINDVGLNTFEYELDG